MNLDFNDKTLCEIQKEYDDSLSSFDRPSIFQTRQNKNLFGYQINFRNWFFQTNFLFVICENFINILFENYYLLFNPQAFHEFTVKVANIFVNY